MALTLHIATICGLRGRADRQLKATFRGVSQSTKVLEAVDGEANFNESLSWPVGRPIESHETLHLYVCNYSRYRSSRVIGTYGLILQRVANDGYLQLSDELVDDNNMPTNVRINLSLNYQAPADGSLSSWQTVDAGDSGYQDECQALLDLERNIANFEQHLSESQRIVGNDDSIQAVIAAQSSVNLKVSQRLSRGSIAPGRCAERKRSLSIKTLATIMKFGKHRPEPETEERLSLKGHADQYVEYGSMASLDGRSSDGAESVHDNADSISLRDCESLPPPTPSFKERPVPTSSLQEFRAQDFQVCVTIIEARQLAGLNMDPVVCVQVGDQRKYSSVRESTNCPYYNEYFVFDFHVSTAVLFDKIISLTVLHSRNIIRSGKILGTFKLDVGTVWSQTDHQFYHKWAVLTDPEDIAGGPKGYLKCDLCVIGKGDTVKIPQKSEKDEDDIEENLLLPEGFPAERQRARFIVRIYRADGLPRVNVGLVANFKKALSAETRELVDPYVQISFAGLTGKTSVKKHTCQPVWNEQVVFMEMFPHLCQRIKIQLRDSDSVNDTVIGTHYLELGRISNSGDKGFLPTYGPSFVHLYGNTRDGSFFDDHNGLNDGIGEGVSYRGRLLIAVCTEVLENVDVTSADVEVEPTMPVVETSYGRCTEFFLLGTIMEADMIDKRIGDKPIYFEISIGNAGNALDGQDETTQLSRGSDNGLPTSSPPEAVVSDSPRWQSTTPPLRPLSRDRKYYSIPYADCKPCVYIFSNWQDHRKRMYTSNALARIADNLEENIAEIRRLIIQDSPFAEKCLKKTTDDLSAGCSRFLAITKGDQGAGAGSGRTRLDKERHRMLQRELEHIRKIAASVSSSFNRLPIKDKLKVLSSTLQKLRTHIEDPQQVLPDVFIWMISGSKRLAYHRIPARDLIYSVVEEESGRDCGILQTVFLRLPGKKGSGTAKWNIQAKLSMHLWLGVPKHKKNCLRGLPSGYDITADVLNIDKPHTTPPSNLRYRERYVFQLRAHLYEGRSLIASDSSGLSDPFARVVIGDQSQISQVIDETLSPTWDETLIFNDVVVYGTKEYIKDNPPPVVIEIFDQDKVGKAEFIGRTVAKPHVKTSEDPYKKPFFPPTLAWYDLHRGIDPAGQLLATFELIQVSERDYGDIPPPPEPKETSIAPDIGPIFPVPKGIRPVLSKHRIEVLFWGLRNLKRIQFMSVDRPRVDIECGGRILQSSVIQNYKKNPNFSVPVKYFDVDLPDEALYCPSLTLRVIDCRSFGRYTLVGTHVINSLQRFIYTPTTKRDRDAALRKQSLAQTGTDLLGIPDVHTCNMDTSSPSDTVIVQFDCNKVHTKEQKCKNKRKDAVVDNSDEEENQDWWTKYFASVETMIEESREAREVHSSDETILDLQNINRLENEFDAKKAYKDLKFPDLLSTVEKKKTFHGAATAVRFATRLSPYATQKKRKDKFSLIKIYPTELEAQPEFEGFKEWLHTFELYRGKKALEDGDDESRIVGKFKGSLHVYKLPLPPDAEDQNVIGGDPQFGLFQGIPSNEPIHVLVRVYIVKGTDLHPMDINGKADPYLVLTLGCKRVNDKENYQSKQLNPVFGKCYEFEAIFPQDSLLTVQIYDWDLVGADDLIGETKIDLENRFYSRHRATCGLSMRYEPASGFNQWRDPVKPLPILARLCRDHKLDGPHFSNNGVRIGGRNFCIQGDSESDHVKPSEEEIALAVLHRWEDVAKVGCTLIPEHVETRPLYHPSKPGLEQGKLEIWVDMFPMDMPRPGPPIDISPRKPKSFELRVIIWNTDEVVLEDDAFFTGEKMSDIYVKGWLQGQEDTQTTDIHYRSLTGEGNFNWRFIFPFEYLVAEEKIVISRKESMFSWDETESKIPARLVMQVWDADHFSADDFLGAMTLDLNRFPRGAKSAKLCTLNMLKTDGSVPMISLFKQRRVKGWWPFYVKRENEEMELTGKVEAELQLLNRDEAERSPAGLGRNEPDPLEKPNRPDSSFIWFLNPLKSIRYIVWQNYKWVIVKCILALLLVVLFLLFLYSMPGYSVKKMFGA